MSFDHSLVVGGTGMLSDATRFIKRESHLMTLISRNARSVAPSFGVPVDSAFSLDWRDTETFAASLSTRLQTVRPDFALLWIHSNGHQTLLWIMRTLSATPATVVQVVGRSFGDPNSPDPEIDAIVSAANSMHYTRVVLGSVETTHGLTRWLTNDEISNGTIQAIISGRSLLVGDTLRRTDVD